MLFTCRCLAAPFRPLDQNCANIRQFFVKNLIRYSFAIFFHLPYIISYTPYRRQCPFGYFSNFRSAVFPISVRLFFRNLALILCACDLPFKVAGLPMEDSIMIAHPPLICQPPQRFSCAIHLLGSCLASNTSQTREVWPCGKFGRGEV